MNTTFFLDLLHTTILSGVRGTLGLTLADNSLAILQMLRDCSAEINGGLGLGRSLRDTGLIISMSLSLCCDLS